MASLNFNLSVDAIVDKPRDYTYKDLEFTLKKKNNNYGFKELFDAQAIENGVKNIFDWKQGQRIILPEFGNVLYKYLYQPINEVNAQNIGIDIKNMFKWEPRVRVENINIDPYPDENQYDITITYSVPLLDVNKNFKFTHVLKRYH